MFSRLNSIIYGGCAVLILGLCSWLWVQSQMIDRLEADNQNQAQTISQLETAQQHLSFALKQEQQAVEKQQKLATALRTQMEAKREQVKTILVKEPCAATRLPHGIIEQLQHAD